MMINLLDYYFPTIILMEFKGLFEWPHLLFPHVLQTIQFMGFVSQSNKMMINQACFQAKVLGAGQKSTFSI